MKIKVIKYYDNMNLSAFLDSFHLGKKNINSILNSKNIKINDVIVVDSNYVLKKDDIIEINEPQKINMIPYKIHLDILYEDDFIIIVNKPKNILIHTDGNTYETLTNAVYNYLKTKKERGFAYPVHRIDYETTGIVLFAKNEMALSFLSVEIENHNVEKEYVCLVHNKFKKTKDIINKPIGRDRHSEKQVVCAGGKSAETSYMVLKNDLISKVKVNIKHGRKHQIRVHMSHINHPIVGDSLYGKDDSEELKLHFKKIKFIHPYTREHKEIICQEDF